MTSKSIIIVEDEKDVRDVMAEMIAMFGYQVTIHSNGAEAWKDIAANKYDLIITDLGLPGLDGGELIMMMRRNGIKIPALIIAGVDSESSGIDLKKIPKCAFIQKPFRIDDLKYQINDLLKDDKKEFKRK
jgi:DNA-binding NtrC family response regulator